MTKILSDFLGAQETLLRHTIRQLEQAAGMPCEDIRLTTDISRIVQRAVRELGLDPRDTAPKELYAALSQKVGADEAACRAALGLQGEVSNDLTLAAVQKTAKKLLAPLQTFGVRAPVSRRLLKAHPPKQAMKLLGYRSLDSMLKHEPPAAVYAAAQLCESSSWLAEHRAQYKTLSPSDFEVRKVRIELPKTVRWQRLAQSRLADVRHNILYFSELGSIVILPLPSNVQLPGLTLVTLLLTLQAGNEISAASSFLKLQQVRPDFGEIAVKACADSNAFVVANVGTQPVSWRLVHRYFSERGTFPAHIFEPHVQADDLWWRHAEHLLAGIIPSLAFWAETRFSALVQSGEAVSLNLFDAILNYCNSAPFSSRIMHYAQENAWHELTSRYINQQNIESAVTDQLGRALSPEPVLI